MGDQAGQVRLAAQGRGGGEPAAQPRGGQDSHLGQPARLAVLVGGQWEIENRARWVWDVAFDEDRSQVRAGHGP